MALLQLTRRQCLRSLSVSGLALAAPRAFGTPQPASTRFVAAWQNASDHWVGVIEIQADAWRVVSACALPGRAHGLQPLGDGSVLVAARRPGDWLLRWHPTHDTTSWFWETDDRRYNGHVLTATPNAKSFLTTETDLASGQGLIGLRDLHTLEKLAEWPSHGMDPHEMLVLPCAWGLWPAGTLLVANGGIPTQAESGRSKKSLDRMDPSLVALNPRTGELLGQWRLPDARLSIRHLAWNPASKRLGIALQSEHDAPQQRQQAPVLATWDGLSLSTTANQPALQGYGGSIIATPQGGFIVSCPKVNRVVSFDASSAYLTSQLQRDVCPMAWHQGRVWSAGANEVGRSCPSDLQPQLIGPTHAADSHKFDNHWITWGPAEAS